MRAGSAAAPASPRETAATFVAAALLPEKKEDEGEPVEEAEKMEGAAPVGAAGAAARPKRRAKEEIPALKPEAWGSASWGCFFVLAAKEVVESDDPSGRAAG